jgi:hypothetical protein
MRRSYAQRRDKMPPTRTRPHPQHARSPFPSPSLLCSLKRPPKSESARSCKCRLGMLQTSNAASAWRESQANPTIPTPPASTKRTISRMDPAGRTMVGKRMEAAPVAHAGPRLLDASPMPAPGPLCCSFGFTCWGVFPRCDEGSWGAPRWLGPLATLRSFAPASTPVASCPLPPGAPRQRVVVLLLLLRHGRCGVLDCSEWPASRPCAPPPASVATRCDVVLFRYCPWRALWPAVPTGQASPVGSRVKCGPALSFTRVAVCGRARATVLEVRQLARLGRSPPHPALKTVNVTPRTLLLLSPVPPMPLAPAVRPPCPADATRHRGDTRVHAGYAAAAPLPQCACVPSRPEPPPVWC